MVCDQQLTSTSGVPAGVLRQTRCDRFPAHVKPPNAHAGVASVAPPRGPSGGAPGVRELLRRAAQLAALQEALSDEATTSERAEGDFCPGGCAERGLSP